MGPRATVQQAVELLKIHQLRRENAVIHQQIQDLRDTVVDLKDTHQKFCDGQTKNREEAQKVKVTGATHEKQIKGLASSIEGLLQRFKQTEDNLADERDQAQRQTNNFCQQQSKLKESLQRLEVAIRKRDRENDETHHDTIVKLTALEDRINGKADLTDMILLKAQMKGIEDMDVVAVECPRSLSLIQDSMDHQIRHRQEQANFMENSSGLTRHDQLLKPADITKVRSSTADEPYESEDLATIHTTVTHRESTVPEDIDLDEATEGANDVGHDAQSSSGDDSRDNLLSNSHSVGLSAPRHAVLKQQQSEGTSTYMKRGHELLTSLLTDAEQILLYRLIDGLSDANQKKLCERWLDAFTWSWKALEEITTLAGLNEAITTEMAIEDPDRGPSEHNSLQNTLKYSKAPQQVNAGPDRSANNSLSASKGNRTFEVRRSPRLAHGFEKQRVIFLEQMDHELTSQPMRFDTRAAMQTTIYEAYKDLPSCRAGHLEPEALQHGYARMAGDRPQRTLRKPAQGQKVDTDKSKSASVRPSYCTRGGRTRDSQGRFQKNPKTASTKRSNKTAGRPAQASKVAGKKDRIEGYSPIPRLVTKNTTVYQEVEGDGNSDKENTDSNEQKSRPKPRSKPKPRQMYSSKRVAQHPPHAATDDQQSVDQEVLDSMRRHKKSRMLSPPPLPPLIPIFSTPMDDE